jgi:hypothetical protein
MREVESVVCMKVRNTVGKHQAKIPLMKPRNRGYNIMKTDIKKLDLKMWTGFELLGI